MAGFNSVLALSQIPAGPLGSLGVSPVAWQAAAFGGWFKKKKCNE